MDYMCEFLIDGKECGLPAYLGHGKYRCIDHEPESSEWGDEPDAPPVAVEEPTEPPPGAEAS